MKLKIDVLILGGGLSGFAIAHELKAVNPVIIEQGYQLTSNQQVVVSHTPHKFTMPNHRVIIYNRHSGTQDFQSEFSKKVYAQTKPVQLFPQGKPDMKVWDYDIKKLTSDVNIYGNFKAEKIDIEKKIVFGTIVHTKRKFEIHYQRLLNTLPLHSFLDLCSLDPLMHFNAFINYFPVGIQSFINLKPIRIADKIIVDYYSDYEIPFYRKYTTFKLITYEYCINKPMDVNFHRVVKIGKFNKLPHSIHANMVETLNNSDIFLIGRFATWNPDALIEHIILREDKQTIKCINKIGVANANESRI